MIGDTLREQMQQADERRFVGRAAELATIDRLLASDTDIRFLLIHGPGGIGKSTLVREVARRGTAAGYRPVSFDGRALPATLDGLRKALAVDGDRPLVLIDEIAALGANLLSLREILLDQLPGSARVVLAGRELPPADWWSQGLDAATRVLRLDPFTAGEATELLTRRGITDPTIVNRLLDWSHGSPLALTVAAEITAMGGELAAGTVEEHLLTWLAGGQADAVDRELVEVAALSWSVDNRLLAAAMPGRPTRAAMSQLLQMPVVRRVGNRAELHPVLAAATRARLKSDNPTRYRTLVKRIAEHLAMRAKLGDVGALLDLSELIEDPAIRAAMSGGASVTHLTDIATRSDLDHFASLTGLADSPAWAPVEQLAALAPRHTFVVREASGRSSILGAFSPLSDLDEDVVTDPLLQQLLDVAHKRDAVPHQTFLCTPVLIDLDPEVLSESLRVGNAGAMLRAGNCDMRWSIAYYPNADQIPRDYLQASGYEPLRFGPDGTCWIADFGPGGIVGFVLATILAEQGFTPLIADESVLADADRLRIAIDTAFRRSEKDLQLRAVLELTHLDELPAAEIIERLHVSRATYYRLLRTARERVLGAD